MIASNTCSITAIAEPCPGCGERLPEDDLDGVLERLLADADALDDLPPIDQMHDEGDEPEFTYGSCAPSGWLALDLDTATADPARLTDHTLVEAIVGYDRLASWAAARQARLLDELARRRPDRQGAVLGAVGRCGQRVRPGRGRGRSAVGTGQRVRPDGAGLPAARHAARHPRVLGDRADRHLEGPRDRRRHLVLSDEQAPDVEARCCPGPPEQTLAQLKAALARAVIAADPEGAEQRHREARRDRRVVVTTEPDGMGALWALLTATDAAGAFTWLTRLARGLGSDDPAAMDARRADILAALLNGRLVLPRHRHRPTDDTADRRRHRRRRTATAPTAEAATGGSDTTADGTAVGDSATGRGTADPPRHPRQAADPDRDPVLDADRRRRPARRIGRRTARSPPPSPARSPPTGCGAGWSPTRCRAPCSTTAAPPTTHPPGSPTTSGPATSTAGSPAAADEPPTPNSTTSSPGPTAAPPASRTSPRTAPTTTG